MMLLFVILEIPILLLIIFLKGIMEKRQLKNAAMSFSGKPAEEFERAKRMASMGEYKLSLASLRNSLEALIEYIACRYGINVYGVGLFDKIEILKAEGLISEYQCGLMHKIRMASSHRGSHVSLNETPVTSAEAYGAIAQMNELVRTIKISFGQALPELFGGRYM